MMSTPISPISIPQLITADDTQTAAAKAPGASFHAILDSTIRNIEASSAQADAAVSNYLSGSRNQELHSTILATQNADLNFQMFLQVRNKVVSAYEEIMKMQV